MEDSTFPKVILISLAALLIAALILGGMQCKSCQQFTSHVKSGVTGLNRRVTLYANNGTVIKQWEGKLNVEDSGGTIRFLDNSGNAIILGGTFIVEENPTPITK